MALQREAERDTAERKGQVRSKQLSASQEESLPQKTKAPPALSLDLQSLELRENKFVLLKPHKSMEFCYGSLNRLIHSPRPHFEKSLLYSRSNHGTCSIWELIWNQKLEPNPRPTESVSSFQHHQVVPGTLMKTRHGSSKHYVYCLLGGTQSSLGMRAAGAIIITSSPNLPPSEMTLFNFCGSPSSDGYNCLLPH